MSRRKLAYAVLVVASFVASACAQPTAPTNEDTACRGTVIISQGANCQQ